MSLSEVLHVNSRYTAAEAYNENLDLLDVVIQYNDEATTTTSFDLLQNLPNPFKTETIVRFTLEEVGFATLKVYDISGRILLEIAGDYEQGYNEIVINRTDLQASGVVYYQLDTKTNSATRKMIIIE